MADRLGIPLSASHRLLTTFGSGLINVYAMAVDIAGNVYALQTGFTSAGIMKFAPDGRQLNTFTALGGPTPHWRANLRTMIAAIAGEG